MNKPADILEDVKELQRQEREAILAADFSQLERLVKTKERLMGSLEGLSSHELAELKASAQANHRLLSSAMKGVQAAQRRLTQIVASTEGFTTYDTAGRGQLISSRGSSVEKKA